MDIPIETSTYNKIWYAIDIRRGKLVLIWLGRFQTILALEAKDSRFLAFLFSKSDKTLYFDVSSG